ncbi:MAG: NupC/NupG family nucleoside CNT transporter [Acetobacter sp.]|nr:NupC/NupG family nucleoside CNT transporter [Acetobacter sp.]MCH4061660.1 NupC/NupG family nucleoside CNT transporter [Acetobacter sp.]MCH4089491.1 NupC/NupG family nucleoside CNT transporter [Acetobacter sp.]MCI1321373.1 NupC/NupG family nucleoside CNT transporter [Acetobacter sp.]MCI1374925.1 NupC/NupG family nucleoside CNT transporter [Acetobacter sp.]
MTVHLRPLLGIAALLLVGVVFSSDRRNIKPRVILPALTCQFAFGLLMLGVPAGRAALSALAGSISWVADFGHVGISFVFGALANPELTRNISGAGLIFAINILPQIIYLSALIGVLYHYNVMQLVARGIGAVLTKLIGVSTVEAFSSAMAMFLGQTEVPIAIRPYLMSLSRSELLSAMSSGTASISMSMLAAYAGLGVPVTYLLAASFMAMPGGLLFAKLIMPSDGKERNDLTQVETREIRSANVFDALAVGAGNGLKVAVSVAAMLIAFISTIALLNAILGIIGHKTGFPDLSVGTLFGCVLRPVIWLLGVPWDQSSIVAGIVGTKIAVNEFVAYGSLAPFYTHQGLTPQALAIASFALCGFANLSSIGVLIGSFGSQCPERRQEVARLGWQAVLAGTLSNLTSAAIAGMFIS